MIVCVPVPTAVGVYVTEQLAVAPVPARVQLAALKVPAPLLVKPTVPVGVVGVAEVSVTVAVQDAAWLTTTDPGVQVTAVVVGWRAPTVRANVPELVL